MTESCPVFRPSIEEFSRPFTEFVSAVFRDNPDMPAFKVVPPQGWAPRSQPFPDLKTVTINTPIRQNAFGRGGAYKCFLVEQKPLTVAQFKAVAASESGLVWRGGSAKAAVAQPPPSRHIPLDISSGSAYVSADDTSASHASTLPSSSTALDTATSPTVPATAAAGSTRPAAADDPAASIGERAFWASVTLNPPLYGADTPVSFFDERLTYGWNLRDLGDLLHTHDVPDVPGVTTPMTYFGMWRAFFGWHKEDVDLLSINYMHFGAPKVWYCVSPRHKAKFERMAAQLFPDMARACPAFTRHKEILISPAQLRTFGIPFVQAKQCQGEFMVLNAAAYHAGYNVGFNCAEAVNFATKEWVDVGKAADRCRCSLMKDAVRISMRLFDPDWLDSDDEEEEEDEEDEEDVSGEGSDSGASGSAAEPPATSWPAPSSASDAGAARLKLLTAALQRAKEQRATAVAAAAAAHAVRVASTPACGCAATDRHPSGLTPAAEQLLRAAYGRVRQRVEGRVTVPAPLVQLPVQLRTPHAPTPTPARPQLPDTSAPSQTLTSAKRAALALDDNNGGEDDGEDDSNAPGSSQRRRSKRTPRSAADAAVTGSADAICTVQPPPPLQQPVVGGVGDVLEVLRDLAKDPGQGPPAAIVWDSGRGSRLFHLVLPLRRTPGSKTKALIRVLQEQPDGLFYPTTTVLLENKSALLPVRTQQVRELVLALPVRGGQLPAWRLLTLRTRILNHTDLVD